MKIIIIFGPPGSGKGTQSVKIVEKYNLKHLSTGDMLREEVKNKSKIGLEVNDILSSGKLVPDNIVIDIIKNNIVENKKYNGYILDGYPRTKEQAINLDQTLIQKNFKIDLVISLKVDKNELIKRIIERGKTSNRPDDANEKLVEIRIEEYLQKTSILEKYYKDLNVLSEINGMLEIENVFSEIVKVINNKIY